MTLAPSLTELVLRLGAGERLVGVSRYDEAAEVEKLPRVGGFVDPSVEAVLTLGPHLVLVQPAPGNQRPIEKLAELGIPILAVPMHTIAETFAAIEAVGAALDRKSEAKSLVDAIQKTREKIRASAKDRPAPAVMIVYGFEPLVVSGPGSFASELLADAGAKNVVTRGSAYIVLPLERALMLKPDVVIDASDSSAGRERVMAMPGLDRARWVRPKSKALLQPGPSLGTALEELEEILAPVQAAE